MNESLTFIHDLLHFMKWIAKYIWNCPFHEMDSWVVHFMKCTISQLGCNTYIWNIVRRQINFIKRTQTGMNTNKNTMLYYQDLRPRLNENCPRMGTPAISQQSTTP